jgi:hypothetical protein
MAPLPLSVPQEVQEKMVAEREAKRSKAGGDAPMARSRSAERDPEKKDDRSERERGRSKDRERGRSRSRDR